MKLVAIQLVDHEIVFILSLLQDARQRQFNDPDHNARIDSLPWYLLGNHIANDLEDRLQSKLGDAA